MTTQPAPQPLTVPELLKLLAALDAPAEIPAHPHDAETVLRYSHRLVGAAERKAMEAELAMRATGAGEPEIVPATEEAYAAVNAQSRLDVLAHLQWRATRLVRALQALRADTDGEDALLATTIAAAVGMATLLSAQAFKATGESDGATLTLGKGVRALQAAADRARHLP